MKNGKNNKDRCLYRAKRTDNGEWVEGYYVRGLDMYEKEVHMIFEPTTIFYSHGETDGFVEVDPSTICQCTAMPDKNRKIAYEHDIIKTPVGNAKIAWSCSQSPTDNHINVGFEVVFLDAIANDNYRHDLGYWIGKSEVIGSVFDNPELGTIGGGEKWNN